MAPHALPSHAMPSHGASSRAAARRGLAGSGATTRLASHQPRCHGVTCCDATRCRLASLLHYHFSIRVIGSAAPPPFPGFQLPGCLAMLLQETSDEPDETSEPTVCMPGRAASPRSLFFPSWEMPAYQVGNPCVRGQVQAPLSPSPPASLPPSLLSLLQRIWPML